MGVLLVLSLAGLLAVHSVHAQVAAGAITGTIRESSGAVVPGAAVRVVSEATGLGQTVTTHSDGVYLIPQLAPGYYHVAVTAAGFKRVDISGLKVDVGTTLTQDVSLEVGAVTESVSVDATPSLVETTSGQVEALLVAFAVSGDTLARELICRPLRHR